MVMSGKIIKLNNNIYCYNDGDIENYRIYVSTGLYPETLQPSGNVNFNSMIKTIHHKKYPLNDKKN
ncbi:hypothetical protein [Acanthamoeba polyphaga mimivirus]|uniref:Uncharacterized protein n=1 Tax=Acanthamoeba polyphaga mimivirus TaxID=212035 RepID=A0A2L2DKU8_MIMIV|nr:hypothetical protein [Acanthamoeba polyphaga mimivirus]